MLEGVDPAAQQFGEADCRYLRQVYNVPVGVPELDRGDDIGWLIEDFETAYSALYQHVHVHERDAIVVDTCRLVAYGALPDLDLPRGATDGANPKPALRGARNVYFGDWIETPAFWFDDLKPGMQVAGPALIDSESTTVALPPDIAAEVDPYGSLIINNPGGGS